MSGILNWMVKVVDEVLARSAFDRAIKDQRPEFGAFFLAQLLALDISYSDDTCTIRFPVQDFLFNPQGSLHGGIIGTIMDISMGHLIHHIYGRSGATIEMKVQYLRPLTTGSAVCTGQFIKRGKSIAFLESRLADSSDSLVAHATSTWKCSAPTQTASTHSQV
ncbi:PaaI family thioesterase [Mesorhizobium sp. M3A.F.Ca.ET.080.04.2.1]|uniref:PaaI family thioesterase n=1 Tax=Mesorhizobium sp. M3A.F.Ca.ET.080.04.2.1 TaxID=2493676 RepID=UPI001FE16570|nr:PaaI family thioesterase [Mesorhizobium sp. M3A.F.Ca.ET.080.04.2.1]